MSSRASAHNTAGVLPHVLIACAHDSQAIDAARDRFAAAATGVYRLHHTATEQDLPGYRITSYNVCYTKLLRTIPLVPFFVQPLILHA